MTLHHVASQLKRYNTYIHSHTEAECRMKLVEAMTSRHLKVWADNSCITSHSYSMVMMRVLYDPAVFLTDEEYQIKFKVAKSVQSLVEVPTIYTLGLSDATEMDQAMYNEAIHQDLFFSVEGTMAMYVVVEFKGKSKLGKPDAEVLSSTWLRNGRETYWPPFINILVVSHATKNHLPPEPKTWN